MVGSPVGGLLAGAGLALGQRRTLRRTVLFTGGRVPGLVESSRLAPLLVVGTTEKSFAERIWTGTTVTGVSARANCPVVVVPSEWDGAHRHGRVVAAFKSPHHCAELFDRAFELAARDGSELVVLHAWKLASGYDDIVSGRVAEGDWAERQQTIIEPLLADLRHQYPDVPAQVQVVHGQPAGVLVDQGAAADRLMLMRPVHGGFVHHLGAVARAVLREAPCPVEVVPPLRAVASSAGLELERGGEMRR